MLRKQFFLSFGILSFSLLATSVSFAADATTSIATQRIVINANGQTVEMTQEAINRRLEDAAEQLRIATANQTKLDGQIRDLEGTSILAQQLGGFEHGQIVYDSEGFPTYTFINPKSQYYGQTLRLTNMDMLKAYAADRGIRQSSVLRGLQAWIDPAQSPRENEVKQYGKMVKEFEAQLDRNKEEAKRIRGQKAVIDSQISELDAQQRRAQKDGKDLDLNNKLEALRLRLASAELENKLSEFENDIEDKDLLLGLIEERFGDTLMAGFIRQKIAGLLGSDELCKAVASCSSGKQTMSKAEAGRAADAIMKRNIGNEAYNSRGGSSGSYSGSSSSSAPLQTGPHR